MSDMNHSLEPAHRERLVEEVRWYLPAFLSGASVERQDPVQAASELLKLRRSDLTRVLAVHIMLSHPVRMLLQALPHGTRRPIAASHRPRVASRAITSGIDWAATTRHRATSSPLNPEWIIRPARRQFDVPENRALAWLLAELQRRVAAARQSPMTSGTWNQEIVAQASSLKHHRGLAWLENIPATWPGDEVYGRLQADRLGFYRSRVAPAARFLRQILTAPTNQEIAAAICDRYFEPSQDWKLFEISILLRICKALDATGQRVDELSLLDTGRSSFASYRLQNGNIVKIWYQRWPPSSGASELLDAVNYYRIGDAGYSRPDIIVEILRDGVSRRLIVLELKASGSASYLATGFAQLLSYLRERPELTHMPASGWLVAPYRGVGAKHHDGRSLWFVSDDNVASAVAQVAAATLPQP